MDAPGSDDASASRIASAAGPPCDPPPWRLIPSREAAQILGVSLQVLSNWRIRGTGPKYVGTVRGRGNRIYFRRAEVLAFAARRRGEPKEGWVLTRDWLAERGLTLENPTPEGVWWLAKAVDDAFP